jgi:hypothetical protein
MDVDEAQARELLREYISQRYGSGAAAGRAWGRSIQFVSDVLNGRRPIPPEIVSELGWKRIVMYRIDET